MLLEKLITSMETLDETAFGEIADDVKGLRKEYTKVLTDLSSASSTSKSLMQELETLRRSQTTPKAYVDTMEKTLVELQNQLKSKSSGAVQMPIIADDVKLSDANVIVLREVKTAVYMNKLLEFIQNTYRLHQRTQGKKCLLLVLDPLTDEFREMKYRKHKYPINTYSKEIPMLITDKEKPFITSILDLSTFDEITIVDRYMKLAPAVKRTDITTYFLVDSFNDSVDYNLSRSQCVAYVNSEENRFNYVVDPAVDISQYSPTEKAGAIAACLFVGRMYCNEI